MTCNDIRMCNVIVDIIELFLNHGSLDYLGHLLRPAHSYTKWVFQCPTFWIGYSGLDRILIHK